MTRAQARPLALRHEIADDLIKLGLPPDRDVLINCAMSRIGRLADGPQTLLEAVQDAIGPKATVVVPAQTANNSTTSSVYLAATRGMGPAAVAAYEARMPGFDPVATPSFGMGALAEHVRLHQDAFRSGHPQASFAAVGYRAQELMSTHDIDCHLGEASPLGALYEADAMTLLLGVGYEACTALHLAEYRLPRPIQRKQYSCFVMADGQRVRRDYLAPNVDATSFPELGAELDREPFVKRGSVGYATARVLPIRGAVDFAIGWMARGR